jgi:hypothetical protein
MPPQTVSFIVVSVARTTAVDAAQALYRLRRIEEGQTAVFVVVDGPLEDDSTGIVGRLLQNELDWNARGRAVQERHAAHAAVPKRHRDDFARAVTYTDIVDSSSMKTAHRVQHKQEAKHEHSTVTVTHTAGVDLVRCYMSAAPLGARRTLTNASITAIKPHLDALGVGFSPVLERASVSAGDLRRVFSLRCREGAGAALVVMTVVEIWAVHADEDRSGYCVFTADGVVVPAWDRRVAPTERRLVLLGRLLCDDSLAVTEEIELLRFLRARYADLDESIRVVMHCLYSTGFLSPSKAKYMPMLASLSVDDALQTFEHKAATIVDELARMVIGAAEPGAMFGRDLRRLFI